MTRTITFKDDTDPNGRRVAMLTLNDADIAVLEKLRHVQGEGSVSPRDIQAKSQIVSASQDDDVVHVVVQDKKHPARFTRSYAIPRKELFGW